MVRTPVFTGIAVLVLALGIGANTAILSVVAAVVVAAAGLARLGKTGDHPDERRRAGFPCELHRLARSEPVFHIHGRSTAAILKCCF